jgi:hypothetical protein
MIRFPAMSCLTHCGHWSRLGSQAEAAWGSHVPPARRQSRSKPTSKATLHSGAQHHHTTAQLTLPAYEPSPRTTPSVSCAISWHCREHARQRERAGLAPRQVWQQLQHHPQRALPAFFTQIVSAAVQANRRKWHRVVQHCRQLPGVNQQLERSGAQCHAGCLVHMQRRNTACTCRVLPHGGVIRTPSHVDVCCCCRPVSALWSQCHA